MHSSLARTVGRCSGGGALLALAAAMALAAAFGGGRRLAADVAPGNDADGDLLCDEQERVLGTSPTRFDSDYDGYSDLEELARGSSLILADDMPASSGPVHVGMSAHGGLDGQVHVVVGVYSSDLTLRDTSLELGYQVGRRMQPLRNDWVALNSTLQVTTSNDGLGLLSLLDLGIDPALIHALGQVSLYATGSVIGSGAVQSAASVRLLSIDGVIVLQMLSPRLVEAQSHPAPSTKGTIYVPLPVGGGSLPSSWSAGEVCFQRASPVAVGGATITQEVVSADCLNGWDGYCPPTCTASVGSTYTTVDPVALIGG